VLKPYWTCCMRRSGAATTRLVGAGLALPFWSDRSVERGQGKPSPYQTLELFAKKRRIHKLAIQNCFVERRREGLDDVNLPDMAIRAQRTSH
jgi:hypothetical protein